MHKLSVAAAQARPLRWLIGLFLLVAAGQSAAAQVEVAPWGNVSGIRSEGQLLAFETGLRVVSADGRRATATGKERQRPHYARNGPQHVITTRLDSLPRFRGNRAGYRAGRGPRAGATAGPQLPPRQ